MNWSNTPDYSIYEESTADGYEVWVATHGDGRDVCWRRYTLLR